MTKTITVHGVLAGAYRGKSISARALLTHASIDGGTTAICRKVKEHALCDAVEAGPPTCPTCVARLEKARQQVHAAVRAEAIAVLGWEPESPTAYRDRTDYVGSTPELVRDACQELEARIGSIESGLRYYDRSASPESTGETKRDAYAVQLEGFRKYLHDGVGA